MYSLSKRSNFTLTHVDKQLCQHHLLKRLFFPHLNDLGTLVKNQLVVSIWVYFWALNSTPLICVSVLTQVPHCVDYYCFAVSFEIGKYESSNFVLFPDDCVCSGSLEFLDEIKDHLVNLCKKKKQRKFW